MAMNFSSVKAEISSTQCWTTFSGHTTAKHYDQIDLILCQYLPNVALVLNKPLSPDSGNSRFSVRSANPMTYNVKYLWLDCSQILLSRVFPSPDMSASTAPLDLKLLVYSFCLSSVTNFFSCRSTSTFERLRRHGTNEQYLNSSNRWAIILMVVKQ